MRRMSGGLILALTLVIGAGVTPVQGQRGPGFRGQSAGPHAGRSLDAIIENREVLGLTEDQLAQIQDLKATMDSEVAPLAEGIRELRDQIQAGEVDRNEGFRQLQALRGEMMIASAPLRGRVQEILTVEQHQRLQAAMRQSRPGPARGGALGGRGQGRMGRGGFRGSRGGFGPRRGFNGQGRVPASGFRQPAAGGPLSGRGLQGPNPPLSGPIEPSLGAGNLFGIR